MVKMSDVARYAQVSSSTVSRVLNGGIAHEATRARVWKAIEELRYTPSVKARGLRLGQSYTIGCIMPRINTDFACNVLDGIETTLAQVDYNLIVVQASTPHQHQEMSYATLLRERRADGVIIVFPREFQHDELLELKRNGSPFMIIEGYDPELRLPSIASDNYSGGFLVTEHLIHAGHRRIAHISGPKHWLSCRERLRGYRDALAKYDLPFDEDYVISGDMYMVHSMEIARALMGRKKPPTALFCVNDYAAIGAIQALKRLELRIPEDVAVAGFDDIALSSFFDPSLTTVRQSMTELGRVAAERLLAMIQNNTMEENETILPVELVIRESTTGLRK